MEVKERFAEHWTENETNYILLAVSFAAGVCSGAFIVGCLNESLINEISVIIANYAFAVSEGGFLPPHTIFLEGIYLHAKAALVLYITGMTPLAVPAAVFTIGWKGLCTGFAAASFFVCMRFSYALKFVLLSLPSQIFIIISLLLMGVFSMSLKKSQSTLLRYSVSYVCLFLLIIIGLICEMFIFGR